jgi:hypothetical protein
VVALLAPSVAHAEGWLSMRGAYYKEKSTRVTQPMIDGQVDLSERDQVKFHALVDSITSASPAAGSPVEFTENRYEGGVGYRRTVGRLQLGGTFRYSTESDYTSYYGSLRGQLELAQKNTTVALTLGRGFDTITDGATGVATREEELQVGLTSLSLTQILSPRLVGSVTFDFSDLHGYQANLYRRVLGGDTMPEERVPDLRLRAALSAGLRWFVAPSRTTVVAGYRFYADDWGILAHTVEGRAIQEVVPGLDLRLRYRFHTQGAADFYKDIYSEAELDDFTRHVTEDAKLSAFDTHTFGGQVSAALELFGVGDPWGTTRLEVEVERILQDNAFGDAWAAQVGLRVPLAF